MAITLLNIPAVQTFVADHVGRILSRQFDTRVTIENINLGLLNRIIIENISIQDQQGDSLFNAARMSAKMQFLPLAHGKIVVDNVQLFGFNVNLYQKNAEEAANYRFILDKFASSDTTKSEIDLRINSLLVRRGKVKHHLNFKPKTPGRFNPNHLDLQQISLTASLKAFSPDSMNFALKKLSFKEQSGLSLKKMAMKFTANTEHATLKELEIKFPKSAFYIHKLEANYDGRPTAETFTSWFKTLQLDGLIAPSYITLSDFSSILPVFDHFNDALYCQAEINGLSNQIWLRDFRMNSPQRSVDLRADFCADFTPTSSGSPTFTANFKNFDLKASAHNFITSNLTGRQQQFHTLFKRLGDVNFQGKATHTKDNVHADGILHTQIGNLKINGNLLDENEIDAAISSTQLQMNKLLADDPKTVPLQSITFDLNIKGKLIEDKHPNIYAKGNIKELTFKEHRYQNIHIDLRHRAQGFEGKVKIDDPHGVIDLAGGLNLKSTIPYAKLDIKVKDFNPHALNLISEHDSTTFSAHITTDLTDNFPNKIKGKLLIKDFSMTSPDGHYSINDIAITSHSDENKQQLTLQSDFIQLQADGKFNYTTLPATIKKIGHKYLPSVFSAPQNPRITTDSLNFLVRVLNADPLQKVACLPLYIPEPGQIEGKIIGRTDKIEFTGYIPEVEYENEMLREIALHCHSYQNDIQTGFSLIRKMKEKDVSLGVSATAGSNLLHTEFIWDDGAEVRNSGVVATTTQFLPQENKKMEAIVRFTPTQIMISDTIWNIHPSALTLHNGKVSINSFHVSEDERFLNINGTISENKSDSVTVNMKDINVEYILDLVKFDDVLFGGEATGIVYAGNILGSPTMSANLNVKNFTFNHAELGLLDVKAKWDDDERAVKLDATINDYKEQHVTHIDGAIYTKHGARPGGLDLNINTQRFNLYFLNQFTSGIFTDFQGRASGWAHLFGSFKTIDLEGDMMINHAHMNIDALNTSYSLANDSVIMRPGSIRIKDAKAMDTYYDALKPDEHFANINGLLQYEHFKNIRYHFDVDAHNLLGYDHRTFGKEVFHGTVFASGNVTLQGRPGELNIDINVRPEKGTTFVYNSSTPETITNNKFITYKVSEEEEDELAYPIADINANYRKKNVQNNMESDMRLNFNIDATPDATLKIIMDPKTGDYIGLNGNGNLRASYYNKGRFQMYGVYNVERGVYKLSIQDIIRKDFQFQPGGTLTFGGAPDEGDLNLQAVHTVPSVSLNDLSSTSTFSNNNVRVNCIMNLNGKAKDPQVTFDFDIPNVNDDEKQMVRSLISTEEEKNMQIIYLLGIGRFYTYDYNNTEQSQSNVAMNSLLSSTLSGQLNQALSSIIGNNNWNIGTNLSTGEMGWSDMDVAGLLSGRLLNNRLLINGNFGYRDNPATASNFIGDFDLQWLLTRNGNVSLKAYSETNDRYFTKSALTTQGIGIMLKKDFNNWREFFKLKRK